MPNVTYGLLLVLGMMQVNNVIFYHEHVLESGEIIRHAHPFLSEEDEQNREHSENEILLLDMLTHVQFFLPDRLGFVYEATHVYDVPRPLLPLEHPGVQFRETLSLRGPPAIRYH
ncbi:hypothetical protein SAMN05192553_103261 [Cyclobacterium xiamenense]|uniref:Uncharacterized protein n=1 Tax=Cyclobacterium xiamenense TaxID=1297121 RepID=A0A1H6XU26_9BACT|nr:hypothetical protein SAMN05192553_103261 [Cyclobacterium xiamenense]